MGSCFAVDIHFFFVCVCGGGGGEGWKSFRTCYDIEMLVCVTRYPGVGTAKTNRTAEQVLLNLKAPFSFQFVYLCVLLVVHQCHKFSQGKRTMLCNLGDLFENLLHQCRKIMV